MNHRERIIRHAAERGFTLIEMLLVLALVAIISAMASPALMKPFASRRILEATDAVRSELCVARADAMRSGRTYVFRYAVGGDQYKVGPQDDATAVAAASGDQDDTTATAAVAALPHDEKTLPEGIKFMADNTADNDSTSSSDQQPDSQADTGDGWSEPIVFYPDGTTSNARLVLVNDRNRAMRIALRGLTGTVTVSDVVRE